MKLLTITLVASAMAITPALADTFTLGKSKLGGPDTLGGGKQPAKTKSSNMAQKPDAKSAPAISDKGTDGWVLGKSKLGSDTKLGGAAAAEKQETKSTATTDSGTQQTR